MAHIQNFFLEIVNLHVEITKNISIDMKLFPL